MLSGLLTRRDVALKVLDVVYDAALCRLERRVLHELLRPRNISFRQTFRQNKKSLPDSETFYRKKPTVGIEVN